MSPEQRNWLIVGLVAVAAYFLFIRRRPGMGIPATGGAGTTYPATGYTGFGGSGPATGPATPADGWNGQQSGAFVSGLGQGLGSLLGGISSLVGSAGGSSGGSTPTVWGGGVEVTSDYGTDLSGYDPNAI